MTFNDNPGILGEEGTAPLGRGGLGSPLPPQDLLWTVAKLEGEAEDKRIANGPLSGPEQVDPCGPGRDEGL